MSNQWTSRIWAVQPHILFADDLRQQIVFRILVQWGNRTHRAKPTIDCWFCATSVGVIVLCVGTVTICWCSNLHPATPNVNMLTEWTGYGITLTSARKLGM